MGAEIATALLIGGTVAKTTAGFQAAEMEQEQLRMQAAAARLKATQENVQRDTQMRNLVGSQIAYGAARGIDPGSASLAAISNESFNQFAQDRHAAELNASIQQSQFKLAESQSELGAYGQAFGNLFEAANYLSAPGVGSAIKNIFKPAPVKIPQYNDQFKGI